MTSSDSLTVERERLLANEQRLRHLLESSKDGIGEVDAEGRCTFMTATGARMLGHSVDALTGTSLHETIHPRSADGGVGSPAECSICQALLTREPSNGQALFWHKDGYGLPVDYSIVPG